MLLLEAEAEAGRRFNSELGGSYIYIYMGGSDIYIYISRMRCTEQNAPSMLLVAAEAEAGRRFNSGLGGSERGDAAALLEPHAGGASRSILGFSSTSFGLDNLSTKTCAQLLWCELYVMKHYKKKKKL